MSSILRRFRLVFALLLVLGASTLYAPAAYADTTDESHLKAASDAVNSLWDFVEVSGDLEDEVFYPQFADKAADARQKIDEAYNDLLASQETGSTLEAIHTLQKDVWQMGEGVDAWRAAAVAQDDVKFQTASDQLGLLMDSTFDHDLDLYNAAEYGQRTVSRVALHGGSVAVAFMLSCFFFAAALFRDEKQHDTAKEILRRLRWHRAYAMLAILAGTAIPAVIYFVWNIEPTHWIWLLVLPGFGVLLFDQYRYFRTWLIIRRRR